MKSDIYSYDNEWRCTAEYGNIPYAKKAGPFTYIMHLVCSRKNPLYDVSPVDGHSGKCKYCGETSPAFMRLICLVVFNMI